MTKTVVIKIDRDLGATDYMFENINGIQLETEPIFNMYMYFTEDGDLAMFDGKTLVVEKLPESDRQEALNAVNQAIAACNEPGFATDFILAINNELRRFVA